MKNNRSKVRVLPVTIFTSAVTICVCLGILGGILPDLSMPTMSSDNSVITLNQDNAPDISKSEYTSSGGVIDRHGVVFRYTNARKVDGEHVQLGPNGILYNNNSTEAGTYGAKTQITSISSVTVVFSTSGTLLIATSTDSSTYSSSVALTSGVSYSTTSTYPYYLRLISDTSNSVTITSVVINYLCRAVSSQQEGIITVNSSYANENTNVAGSLSTSDFDWDAGVISLSSATGSGFLGVNQTRIRFGSSSNGQIIFAFSEILISKVVANVAIFGTDSTDVTIKTNGNNTSLVNTVATGNLTYDFSSDTTASTSLTISCPSGKHRFFLNSLTLTVGAAAPVAVTGVSIPEELEVIVGSSSSLTATITPEDATNKSVTWSVINSSPSGCATISSSGLVSGVAAGTATIRVTTADGGFTDTCSVSVVTVPLDNYISPSSVNLKYDYSDVIDKGYWTLDTAPSTGNINLLVIPVKISGTSNATAANKTKIEKAFFSEQTSDTGWVSLRQYFAAASYGALSVTGTVTDWYDCGYTRSQLSTDTYMATLVDAAVAWYKTTYTSNCTQFDADSNGWIDTVCLIYSDTTNTRAENDNDMTNLWAYTYWQQNSNANVSSPVANAYMWASYNFMNGSNYITIDAHTYIHEYGHCMGLDDYYNYDSSSTECFAGGFDMQDYNVGDYNSFSKMALGWTKPYVVTGNAQITISACSTVQNQTIVLFSSGSSWNQSPFTEYLLFELYAPTGMNQFDVNHNTYDGYPQGPNAYGIRLYHIDARLYRRSSSAYNTFATDMETYNSSYPYYEVIMKNTTAGDADYSSRVASLRNYRIVQLIQAGSSSNTFSTSSASPRYLTAADLFDNNDTFTMSAYSEFFYNSGKMNSGSSINYSVTFNVNSSTGTATLTFMTI
ncbi:MAG: Ig-like domain-containing protein [Bacilli bacterium]|jgi:M6 family metalloprotease-like protein